MREMLHERLLTRSGSSVWFSQLMTLPQEPDDWAVVVICVTLH